MLVELCFAKMDDSTAILARFVICRAVLCELCLPKSEGCLGESKSFCNLIGLAGGRRDEFFAGCLEPNAKFRKANYAGGAGPGGLRRVPGG